MLMPKKTKFRKVQRGRMTGKCNRGNKISYGDYGLVALEPGWIKANQIESARVVISKFLKRGGKMWIKIFPDKPVSKKPIGTRMGNGKGNVEFWVAVVKTGKVLFEVSGISIDDAKRALRLAGDKLPVKTKIIYKSNDNQNTQSNSNIDNNTNASQDIIKQN